MAKLEVHHNDEFSSQLFCPWWSWPTVCVHHPCHHKQKLCWPDWNLSHSNKQDTFFHHQVHHLCSIVMCVSHLFLEVDCQIFPIQLPYFLHVCSWLLLFFLPPKMKKTKNFSIWSSLPIFHVNCPHCPPPPLIFLTSCRVKKMLTLFHHEPIRSLPLLHPAKSEPVEGEQEGCLLPEDGEGNEVGERKWALLEKIILKHGGIAKIYTVPILINSFKCITKYPAFLNCLWWLGICSPMEPDPQTQMPILFGAHGWDMSINKLVANRNTKSGVTCHICQYWAINRSDSPASPLFLGFPGKQNNGREVVGQSGTVISPLDEKQRWTCMQCTCEKWNSGVQDQFFVMCDPIYFINPAIDSAEIFSGLTSQSEFVNDCYLWNKAQSLYRKSELHYLRIMGSSYLRQLDN